MMKNDLLASINEEAVTQGFLDFCRLLENKGKMSFFIEPLSRAISQKGFLYLANDENQIIPSTTSKALTGLSKMDSLDIDIFVSSLGSNGLSFHKRGCPANLSILINTLNQQSETELSRAKEMIMGDSPKANHAFLYLSLYNEGPFDHEFGFLRFLDISIILDELLSLDSLDEETLTGIRKFKSFIDHNLLPNCLEKILKAFYEQGRNSRYDDAFLLCSLKAREESLKRSVESNIAVYWLSTEPYYKDSPTITDVDYFSSKSWVLDYQGNNIGRRLYFSPKSLGKPYKGNDYRRSCYPFSVGFLLEEGQFLEGELALWPVKENLKKYTDWTEEKNEFLKFNITNYHEIVKDFVFPHAKERTYIEYKENNEYFAYLINEFFKHDFPKAMKKISKIKMIPEKQQGANQQ